MRTDFRRTFAFLLRRLGLLLAFARLGLLSLAGEGVGGYLGHRWRRTIFDLSKMSESTFQTLLTTHNRHRSGVCAVIDNDQLRHRQIQPSLI